MFVSLADEKNVSNISKNSIVFFVFTAFGKGRLHTVKDIVNKFHRLAFLLNTGQVITQNIAKLIFTRRYKGAKRQVFFVKL